jgi:hypothetical protein
VPGIGRHASFVLDARTLGSVRVDGEDLVVEEPFVLGEGAQLAVEYELARDASYTVGHIPMRIHAPGDDHESR